MLTLNDGRAELWQWDTGRTLAVDADCSQVHFSNKVFGRSIDVDVVDGVATIPDILLQTDKDLNVWAFVGMAKNGYTKISKTFKVNRRNKPADYVFTPPEQTSLEEIKERVSYLESMQDPDAIKNAVNDYLEQNPVEAPVQSVNGQTGTVALTAEDVGAISQDNLQEATNEALSKAKASGEFDGADGQPGENGTDGYSPTANVTQTDSGATITITDKNGTTTATVTNGKDGADGNHGADGSPGKDGADGKSAYQYAVEGGYSGTEAEFAAKLAAEKFANPHALTFTGAVTGSYDGSAPVSVEIPSGGGSGSAENWRLVNTVTTAEDVSNITITQDSDGNPLSLKKVSIFAKVRGNSSSLSAWCRITVNNLQNYFYSDLPNTFAAKEGQDYYNRSRADFSVRSGRLMLDLLLRSLNNAASKNTLYLMANTGVFENYPDVVDAITSIRMWSGSAGIGAGTELMIYGVDA